MIVAVARVAALRRVRRVAEIILNAMLIGLNVILIVGKLKE